MEKLQAYQLLDSYTAAHNAQSLFSDNVQNTEKDNAQNTEKEVFADCLCV